MNKPQININKKFQETQFRVKPAENFSVDFKNKVIKNVVLCQVGEAKGHGVSVEQRFMDTVVESGSTFEKGLKMRFGHPSMCEETFGSFVGNAKNLTSHTGEARGDIHLSDVASDSPKFDKDPVEYLLKMAKDHPDQIMLSVVTYGGYYYQYDKDDEEYKIEFDEYGYPTNLNSKETVFYAPEHCDAVDFVEAGALTDSLFSQIGLQFNQDFIGPKAIQFLDENPLFDRVLRNNPEKAIALLEKRYGSDSVISKIKNLFNKKDPDMEGKEFYIEGTTSEGTAITVTTENSKAGIGDSVVETESGDALADGDHAITDGDMAGQTITVAEGVITGVALTEDGGGEGDPPPAGEDMSAGEKAIMAKFEASEKASKKLQEENAAQFAEIQKEMGMDSAESAAAKAEKEKQHNEGGDKKETFAEKSSKMSHNKAADDFLGSLPKKEKQD